MIAFACAQCGTKLRVKPEFAGRQSKCPSCKQPLIVPTPSATVPFVPPQQIDGTESSLAKAGIDAGVTLGQPNTSHFPSGSKSLPTAAQAGRRCSTQRYVIEGEIARGGMGAVLRAVDCDLRREIAVKYMLDAKDPKKQARFVEEAQINSQLEHPNIVPVYDLGIDAQKRPFIMMKMVKGRSLKDVFDQLRDTPRTAEKEWSLGRLLNILVSVCNALAFAHSRGVIHRDLKPANIMLGDFGEVYVMDWGLAKVLGHEGQGSPAATPGPTVDHEPERHVSTLRSNRQGEADLTQEGAVIGTPAYMPPEQATGDLQAIDLRSDVYSLGAILYELLTLQPPVDKEGGYLSVLMRVMQGEIVPPERRDPKRTRAGKVPKELAAVTVKAMAKEKEQRYPNVEELRKDIERFQEGRSVSAKEDTKWEMIWKFAKRNKGFSAGLAVAFIVVLSSLGFVTNAWLETGKAHAALRKRTEDAVPALIRSARLSINDRQWDDALKQIDVALTYAEDHPEARLLKAQVLIVQKDLPNARAELERYVRLKPGDQEGQALLQLCQDAKRIDTRLLLAFADVFRRQNADVVMQEMYQHVEGDIAGKKKIVAEYQQRIRKAWPTAPDPTLDEANGTISLRLQGIKITDLAPLQGLPLNSLDLTGCEMRDLTPLKGMPLAQLQLATCRNIRDLTPLRGMPLTYLNAPGCSSVVDLTPLKDMKLTWLAISGVTDKDFLLFKGMPLTFLRLSNCGQLQDLGPLRGMPLTSLQLTHCGQLQDLEPLRGTPLTAFGMLGCGKVRDLSPLKDTKLRSLDLTGWQGQDFTWLASLKLTQLSLTRCLQLRDLTLLKGMPLTTLVLIDIPVQDLTPIKAIPITNLCIDACDVRDLTPLEGMKLETMVFNPKTITKGMDVLRKIKTMKSICPQRGGADLPPAEFWRKYDAGEFK